MTCAAPGCSEPASGWTQVPGEPMRHWCRRHVFDLSKHPGEDTARKAEALLSATERAAERLGEPVPARRPPAPELSPVYLEAQQVLAATTEQFRAIARHREQVAAWRKVRRMFRDRIEQAV